VITLKALTLYIALIAGLAGTSPCPARSNDARNVHDRVSTTAPLGLPPVLALPTDPDSQANVDLGRRLFFDPILSGGSRVSCATCHKPEFGFADNKPQSRGATDKISNRNAPSLLNAAYFISLFWDGRASSLESQIAIPIESPEEMANTIAEVEHRLNVSQAYRQDFAKAWGPGPITFDMVEKSIAAYERTLLSGNSPFDRWKYGHDQNAVNRSVKRGFIVFTSKKKGNCAVCHTVEKNYALFTDNKFHDIGVGVSDGKIADAGRYAVTHDEADRGKFKTPSLRNTGMTAPYMHDGSLKDLKQVLDFYIGGGNSHPNLDKEIHTLDFLTGEERRDLLAFLNSLNGEMPRDSDRVGSTQQSQPGTGLIDQAGKACD
jgi:cytochrome c peroxidase